MKNSSKYARQTSMTTVTLLFVFGMVVVIGLSALLIFFLIRDTPPLAKGMAVAALITQFLTGAFFVYYYVESRRKHKAQAEKRLVSK